MLCNLCFLHGLGKGSINHDTWKVSTSWSKNKNLKQGIVTPVGAGALPYVGGYQVPVIRPTFYANLTPYDPIFFYSVQTRWPLFSTFVSNLTYKLLFFSRAFWEVQILQFCGNFLHTEWPPCLGVHTKKTPFFDAYTEWPPFFDEILHRMPLLSFYGRHLYVTFIFNVPPPPPRD